MCLKFFARYEYIKNHIRKANKTRVGKKEQAEGFSKKRVVRKTRQQQWATHEGSLNNDN